MHALVALALSIAVLVPAVASAEARAEARAEANATATAGQAPRVHSIRLGMSNVHLIRSTSPVLVDAGGKHDMPALEQALAAHRLRVEDLVAVVLTHAHSDHAGLAAAIRRRSGALLVLGAGDRAMAMAGHNDDLQPTNLTAHLLKRFAIDPAYEPFEPDLQVSGSLDLSRFGIAGRAVQMPGHTPGSLAVVLDDGRAIVGDMILGGWLGGALFAGDAGEHYFHADRARNRANVVTLLREPVHTFHLGHGGPVSRESVLKGLDLADPLRVIRSAGAGIATTTPR